MSDQKPHRTQQNDDFLDEYLKRAMEPDSPLLDSDVSHVSSPFSKVDDQLNQAEKTEEKAEQDTLRVTEPVNKTRKKKESKADSSAEEKPTKLKKKRGWYSILGFVVIFAGSLFGYIRYQNTVMKKVIVEGHFYTLEEDILRKATIPSDASPDSIDLYAVMKRVETLPFVKFADITIIPPSQIKILITEREPLALLLDGNKKALVDEDGLIMPQLYDKTPNVPLLYGFSIKAINDTLQSKGFKSISRFLVSLKKHPLGNATISELAWSDSDGVVALSSEDGVKLIFGNAHPDQNIQNWEAFYAQIVPAVGLSTVSEVDLRYDGQVITR